MSILEPLSARLSAILGKDVIPQESGGRCSLHDLLSPTYVTNPLETVEKVKAGKEFTVYAKTLTGKTATNQVTGEDTIDEVKAGWFHGVGFHSDLRFGESSMLGEYMTLMSSLDLTFKSVCRGRSK